MQSKIKFLEEEIESLNSKVDSTNKDRNRLRQELKNTILKPLDLGLTTYELGKNNSSKKDDNYSSSRFTFLNSNSVNSSNFLNDFNASSCCWDVNYNTGFILKKQYEKDRLVMKSAYELNTLTNKDRNGGKRDIFDSMDLNSSGNTPKSYRS